MFGERIQELRKARNLSQVDLAKVLNVTKQSVSNWENSNIQPSIDMLISIARYFGVTTDYLLDMDDRHFLEVTSLSEQEIAHIQMVIDDMRRRYQ